MWPIAILRWHWSHLLLSSLIYSYFCTDLSMFNRHHVMDGSSSAETKFQQDWAHDHQVLDLTICHFPQSVGHPEQIYNSFLTFLTWLGHEGFPFTKSKGSGHFYPSESLRCLFRPLSYAMQPIPGKSALCTKWSLQLIQIAAAKLVFNLPKFSHWYTPFSGFL